MNIIYKENINDITTEYNQNYDKCYIIGKGPTFTNKKRISEKELICCINTSINFLDDYDLLVINDIETIDKIDLNKLKELKYLIIPTYPHLKRKFNKNITYKLILDKFSDYFNGKVLLYNLRTAKKHKISKVINLEACVSGANTICDYILNFSNIRNFETYGVGIVSNIQYHENFTINKQLYNKKKISGIRGDLINRVNKFKGTINFN